MGDDITIGVTEIVNNIEVTAQPNDQVIDIEVIDNSDDVTLNVTPNLIEVNINKGSSYARWGSIFGNLTDQADLTNALFNKADLVDGKVPSYQLPSFVDDVIEVANFAALPTVGETGKIYITLDNNKIYRWSGSTYIEIASNQAIWGAITGSLTNQTDLVNALNLKANISGQVFTGAISATNLSGTNTGDQDLSGLVPNTRTITINGVTQDLSANRSFTIASGVTSVFGRNGDVVAANGDYTTTQVTEGTNLYYTEARVNANSNVAANTAARHSAVTIGTANGLSLSTQVLSLGLASSSVNGALSSTDWTTFNNKQNALTNPITGTGNTNRIPKFTGTTSLANSNIIDNGTIVTIETDSIVNGIRVGRGGGNQYFNTAIGVESLNVNTTGIFNTAIGHAALLYNTTGSFNSSLGYSALRNNTIGTNNCSFGYESLKENTTGSSNVAIGTEALLNITTSSNNIAIGRIAGAYIANSSTSNLTGSNSIFIGTAARPLADAQTNQIVIGDGAIGHGSNTVTLGNSSIATTILRGNVGIGTSNPLTLLYVKGNSLYNGNITADNSSTTGGGIFSVRQNGVTSGFMSTAGSVLGNTSRDLALFSETGLNQVFFTNDTERMRITSSGNVGIGVVPKNWDSLYKVLQISDAALTGTIDGCSMSHNLWQDGETPTYITSRPASSYSQNSGNHYWDTAPSGTANNGMTLTTRMILTNSGNVGIGTTSPTSVGGYIIQTINGTAGSFTEWQENGSKTFRVGSDVGEGGFLYTQAAFGIRFGTNNFERMRITSGGNVGIGITNPAVKLDVLGGNGGGFRIEPNGSSVSLPSTGLSFSTGFSVGYIRNANSSGNVVDLYIDALKVFFANLGTGLVYSNAGALTSTNPSDERLKDDITDLQYGLNEILQLRPVSYNWKNDTINQGKQFGFIAQEVQEVMPELISEFTTTEDKEEVVRLGLDKEGIYAALVNAIKELKAEIEILKNK